MLTMKMFRTRVEFEWDDREVNSTVTLSDTDTQETVLRKLKRVIALVEGEQAALPGGQVLDELRQPADWRDALGPQRVVGRASETPPTNGWAAYAEPKVPERLAGEVEAIKPGEEA